MSTLKCYFAGPRGGTVDGDDFVAACFAFTAAEAKAITWKQSEFLAEHCDGVYFEARVVRQPEFDSYVKEDSIQPYLVHDNQTLRQFGWRMEDDSTSCDSCGLWEMEVVPVCDECNQCDECGCTCRSI